MARCLITLSNVVQSSFNLSPADLAKLKDPIATAGDGRVRFEGFSHCAGVYARVDVLPDGLDGEFLENGTTNVDFNQPMLTALNSIKQKENVLLSIGQKEVSSNFQISLLLCYSDDRRNHISISYIDIVNISA